MVIDICTFNGEFDIWDLHYKTLEPYVDKFIVCEFDVTFSGETKPFYSFQVDRNLYPKAQFMVRSGDNWTEEEKLVAWKSPNTVGAAHFTREFLQKESLKSVMEYCDLKDDDTVFIGDVDEIWSPSALKLIGPFKLKLKVYTYFLNNRSSEVFYGPIKAQYGQIKNLILNHVRTNAPRTKKYHGWHFTSMKDSLRKKLTDSYTQESYATPEVLNNLEYNVEHNQDFLGRNFTYQLDEKEWPEYLKNNRENYQALCKNS